MIAVSEATVGLVAVAAIANGAGYIGLVRARKDAERAAGAQREANAVDGFDRLTGRLMTRVEGLEADIVRLQAGLAMCEAKHSAAELLVARQAAEIDQLRAEIADRHPEAPPPAAAT